MNRPAVIFQARMSQAQAAKVTRLVRGPLDPAVDGRAALQVRDGAVELPEVDIGHRQLVQMGAFRRLVPYSVRGRGGSFTPTYAFTGGQPQVHQEFSDKCIVAAQPCRLFTFSVVPGCPLLCL